MSVRSKLADALWDAGAALTSAGDRINGTEPADAYALGFWEARGDMARAIREGLGLTQDEMATRMGVMVSTVRLFEIGKGSRIDYDNWLEAVTRELTGSRD
jgi:hypothetical protein